MTKEKQYEEQLAQLANHDPLTGLANRHALIKHFELKKPARCAWRLSIWTILNR
jgi:GGDEF domain-containing protein